MSKNYCDCAHSDHDQIVERFKPTLKCKDLRESVFGKFAAMALKHKTINLGQGFPDFIASPEVIEHMKKVIDEATPLDHQYANKKGTQKFREAIARLYSMLIDHEIDPNSEVLATTGAYEAIFCSVFAHADYGEEVIIIEPFFECYAPVVKISGAKPKFIPLRNKCCGTKAEDWKLDKEELESMFNCKTKMIILNTPNNPTGKVFTCEELSFIADLCKKHNVLCICDEVYEWSVYPPKKHFRMASLPGMYERTLTIGSTGKSFGVTGWKLGWVYGPDYLMEKLYRVHDNVVDSCVSLTQHAIARMIEEQTDKLCEDDNHFKSYNALLNERRDIMYRVLQDAGMKPVMPDAGLFMLANFAELAEHIDLSKVDGKSKDFKFATWLVENCKVSGIPPSAFYSEPNKHLVENFLRFCYFKDIKKLEAAGEAMKKLRDLAS